jgi:hypothetical protein
MFDERIAMPVPGNRFTENKAEAVEALRSNPGNARSSTDWHPVGGGISADGQHGFTFGYMTLRIPDSAAVSARYLSYWIKRPEGWRVAVYRRRRYARPPVSVALLPSVLPARLVAPATRSSTLESYRVSLDRAERDFSDSAQKIGIGPAFEMFGSEDAVNMGPGDSPGFIIGSAAIGRSVAGNAAPSADSPVTWWPDRVLVASSGDLGVTIGMLRPNTPGGGINQSAPPIPFFTIWRRSGPGDRWLYVAE